MNLTINAKSVTSYPTPAALNATGVVITIDGNAHSGVNTATNIITDNTSIDITITKSGYYPYSTNIRVYETDLSIDVILVPVITDSTDPDYHRPYPYFTSVRDPRSFNLYLYNTSSAPFGSFTYYLDDVLFETSLGFAIVNVCEAGDYDIKQQIITTSPITGSVLFTEDITNTITVQEYRPALSLAITPNNTCSGDSCCNGTVGLAVEITPTYTLNSDNVAFESSSIQTNGDFASATNPIPGFHKIQKSFPFNITTVANITTVDGYNLAVIHDSTLHLITDVVLEAGSTYTISYDITRLTSGKSVFIYEWNTGIPHNIISAGTGTAVGTVSFNYTATPDYSRITIYTDASNGLGEEAFIDNFSIIRIYGQELTYVLTDSEGTQVGSDDVRDLLSDPDAIFTFTPSSKQDYTLTASLDNGLSVCTKSIIITACDYLSIYEQADSCYKYSLNNCSLTETHTFTLFDVDMTVIGTAGQALDVASSVTITTPGDGVYRVIVYNDDNSVKVIYVVISYCGVTTCLSTLINSILCESCECKDPCKARYKMTRMLPLAYLFMNYINKEYILNSAYTIIDSAKVIELQTIQNVLSKIMDLCDECGTDDHDCGCN